MRLAYLAAAGFLLFGTPAKAQPDELDTERLNREAKALFVLVMKDAGISTRPCGLDSAWSSTPIPFEVAHRVLDLQVFGDLSGPTSVAPPPDIIGGIPNNGWCSQDQWDQYQSDHAAAQAAALLALPKGADAELLWWRRATFSFPIFNQAYDRAVVIHEELRWRVGVVDTKGTVMRAPPEGGGSALVYERKGGVWRQIDAIALFTVD